MLKIGLISDTHSHIDKHINKYFNSCDEIWHAGDIGNISVIEELEKNGSSRLLSSSWRFFNIVARIFQFVASEMFVFLTLVARAETTKNEQKKRAKVVARAKKTRLPFLRELAGLVLHVNAQ